MSVDKNKVYTKSFNKMSSNKNYGKKNNSPMIPYNKKMKKTLKPSK